MLNTITAVFKANTLEAAHSALSNAQANLARVETLQAEAVAKVRDAFEASPTDKTADAVAHAERRADVLLSHARRAVAAAQSEVEAAEVQALALRIGELEATVANTQAAMPGLAKKLKPHATRILETLAEAKRLTRDAENATAEIARLRGQDHDQAWPKVLGARAIINVFNLRARQEIGAADVHALRLFLD